MKSPAHHSGKKIFSKAHIYFFSGTGNAKQTAFWIAEELYKHGTQPFVFDISTLRGKKIAPPEENSIVGFISPTHGFHFPEITRKFINRFPRGTGCAVMIMNTRAGLRIGKFFIPGLSGLVHYVSALRLKYKGYQILGLRPVDLPSNWLSLHPAVRDKGIKLMYTRQESKVRKFTRQVATGNKDYRAIYDMIQDFIVIPVAIAYLLIGRFALAKTFIASHNCTKCGLCQKTCPVKAIKMIQGRMFWTYKCESCMACMNKCPVSAIQTAHGILIGFFALILPFLIIQVFGLMAQIIPGSDSESLKNPSLVFLVKTILTLPFLFLWYRIMHFLLRYRLIERIVVWTSLTSFKFWGRYKNEINPR